MAQLLETMGSAAKTLSENGRAQTETKDSITKDPYGMRGEFNHLQRGTEGMNFRKVLLEGKSATHFAAYPLRLKSCSVKARRRSSGRRPPSVAASANIDVLEGTPLGSAGAWPKDGTRRTKAMRALAAEAMKGAERN
jgi:hypothetical protein